MNDVAMLQDGIECLTENLSVLQDGIDCLTGKHTAELDALLNIVVPNGCEELFLKDPTQRECPKKRTAEVEQADMSMPPPPLKRHKEKVERDEVVFPGEETIAQTQERIEKIKVRPNVDICNPIPLQRVKHSFEAIKPSSEINMVERLYSIKCIGLNVVDDNNDQFRSVAKFVYGNESQYEEVKRQAIGDIRQRPQVYNADSEHVKKIQISQAKGDYSTLYAIAYRFKRKIEIVTDHEEHEGSLIEIDAGNSLEGLSTIILVYMKRTNRYSSVFKMDRKKARKNRNKIEALAPVQNVILGQAARDGNKKRFGKHF